MHAYAASLRKYELAARLVCGREDARTEDLAAWVADTCRALRVPTLAAHGLTREMWPEVVRKSATTSSMKGNPLTLTKDELTAMLACASHPTFTAPLHDRVEAATHAQAYAIRAKL